jgi:beta-mannosidase
MSDLTDSWSAATTTAGEFHEVPESIGWTPASPPVYGSDEEDHWFQCDFTAQGPSPVLTLHGLATICDVFVDGAHRLRSESMFVRHELAVAPGPHRLAICARALAPSLAARRPSRPRWRTKVVAHSNLRWLRTTLLGRAPGFAGAFPVVGPWKPVSIDEAKRFRPSLRTRVSDDVGLLTIACDPALGEIELEISGRITTLPCGGGAVELRRPERWWPHSHGEPTLYPIRIATEGGEAQRSIGFRELHAIGSPDRSRLELNVNGVNVFGRGAVWTPVSKDELRPTLEQVRDAGLNLVRVAGTTVYESELFHDLCDELGLLVWQDLMFANMDYPFGDQSFSVLATEEVEQALEALAGRPSLCVVCGNSEIEQQVAMLGLDPALGRDTFFEDTIPSIMRSLELDAAYIPSAPSGGVRPFVTSCGVANYFGVGAYLRPLHDARRAEVRFASECLAFANVPDETPSHGTGVMRDVGADWDFADVRDHYLLALHGIGRGHPDYWERSRVVTGEVMAEVFGEWRRRNSTCAGGIVLWFRDLEAGAGWGLVDSLGQPKAVYHHLRRALRPIAVWMTDEGLNGVMLHIANDRQNPLTARLRIALYRDHEVLVGTGYEDLQVPARDVIERDAEAVLGHFADVSYAYRFGPPQHDLVVASLELGDQLVSQAFFFPLGRPKGRASADELGLEVTASRNGNRGLHVRISSRRLAYGVRVTPPGFASDDDAFSVEPGGARSVQLRPTRSEAHVDALLVRALNLSEPLRVPVNA